jgi:hypothetical protein
VNKGIGAVPVLLALEMKPLGKTLEQGFLVVWESVPLPYGAPVPTGVGRTVAVLWMMVTESLPAAPLLTPPGAEAAAVGVAVYARLAERFRARSENRNIPQ